MTATATATKTKNSRRGGGFTIARTALQKVLQDVTKAIPARPTNPVLASVLLSNGTLTATNLEIKVSLHVGYDAEPMLVPFAKLLAITRSTSEDEITLSIDGSCCVVECGTGSRRGRWKIPVESASEFPAWEPTDLRPLCHVPTSQFQRAIARVIDATDNESSRYALGGVCIDVSRDDNVATLVATDGRRLHLASIELPDDQDQDNKHVVVPEGAMDLVKKANCGIGHTLIETNGREAVFSADGVQVTARLIEGRFPRWRDVFPADPDGKCVITKVEREVLKQAMNATSIVTTEQSKGVDMTLSATGIVCRAASSESGEAKVSIDVVSGGDERKIKLDPKFVVQWLRAFDNSDEPHVSVSVIDKERACVFKSGEAYSAVIMPLTAD